MADPLVLASLIGAVPATIAAGAAWRSSRKTRAALAVTNGLSPGYMIEYTYEMLHKHVKSPLSEVHKEESNE